GRPARSPSGRSRHRAAPARGAGARGVPHRGAAPAAAGGRHGGAGARQRHQRRQRRGGDGGQGRGAGAQRARAAQPGRGQVAVPDQRFARAAHAPDGHRHLRRNPARRAAGGDLRPSARRHRVDDRVVSAAAGDDRGDPHLRALHRHHHRHPPGRVRAPGDGGRGAADERVAAGPQEPAVQRGASRGLAPRLGRPRQGGARAAQPAGQRHQVHPRGRVGEGAGPGGARAARVAADRGGRQRDRHRARAPRADLPRVRAGGFVARPHPPWHRAGPFHRPALRGAARRAHLGGKRAGRGEPLLLHPSLHRGASGGGRNASRRRGRARV
ncbi:MAG: hypothetical protein AVDCRST_MAG89-5127, partial [uncultured Gemmatimonadetes bacterium]